MICRTITRDNVLIVGMSHILGFGVSTVMDVILS